MDFFRFELFLNSIAADIVLVTVPSMAVETAIAQCTSCCAMARGHLLNTSIVLAAVHGLSGLFRALSTVEPSLSRPLPTLSPCLISNLASVDVKQCGQGQVMCTQNRPLSLTPRSRSDYQPESSTKFYNSSSPDVPTLTLCVLKFDRAESFWLPRGLAKFMFNPLPENEAPTPGCPLLL